MSKSVHIVGLSHVYHVISYIITMHDLASVCKAVVVASFLCGQKLKAFFPRIVVETPEYKH